MKTKLTNMNFKVTLETVILPNSETPEGENWIVTSFSLHANVWCRLLESEPVKAEKPLYFTDLKPGNKFKWVRPRDGGDHICIIMNVPKTANKIYWRYLEVEKYLGNIFLNDLEWPNSISSQVTKVST